MAQQLTLVAKLRQRVEEQGESPAFIFRSPHDGRYVLSWNRLYRLAGRFAAVLNSRGLGRGHLVVNTLVNSPERAVCEAGIWLSGAASVNGHCQMADGSDLLHTLRVSRASALLVDPDVSNSPWNVLTKYVSVGEDDSVTSSDLTNLKKLFFIRRVEEDGPGDFITQLGSHSDWFQADDITPEDTLAVFATSGTMGFSKLVAYTHRDYMQLVKAYFESKQQNPVKTDLNRHFTTAPFGWLGGYVGMGVASCYTIVTCDVRVGGLPKDMPEFIFQVLEKEKCNHALISPVYLPELLLLAERRNAKTDSSAEALTSKESKLNELILTGLPITCPVVAAALSLTDLVKVSYGATDFSVVSMHIVTDSKTFVDHDTGPPIEGVSVKIVSQDDEETALPVNQTGHILVKALKINPGYLDDPKLKTDDYLTKDGFFRTQDYGRLDERGHLIVDGRGNDAIMRGPYIFYPSWMESCIRACPGVRDVIITGVPDPLVNEELCACIVTESDSVTLEHVRHFVEKKVVTTEDDPLSPRPRYYLEFQSFPMTDTGKPKRKVIKAQATERLQCSN
ncbi:3-[(3aS,4S,7aS)-7a-methyl-1,5-dioxo-octahydro-1H-inden-4-yl]propanoyl:CoA ligase-like [Babylonia areolata]|uniref:3-[(3aS,4S,7aS)-7a-methyl-1, 5-dioxo-octahydro-1H-inden-4-yl]propanoyl:CoA ligase-like n=1 Tax=Babylonia areolata TaxID=304850 RepID=UPI003FD3CBD0